MAEPLAAPVHTLAETREFERWMREEQRRIFLICRRMLQDEEEADSATQDVFFKAYKALQQPENKEVDEPAKWLTRIAVNTCLDRLRSKRWQFWRKRPRQDDEDVILAMAATTAPSAEDKMYATEIKSRLHQAIAKLSDRQRSVFLLRHYEDMSLEEIGQTLQLDVGTVKAHMFRATTKLREELRELYNLRPNRSAPGGAV